MAGKNRILYWAPRILCILAILFISIFALDSFSPNYTLVQQLLGFLIHLIPSFILTALLVFAWKWEFAGGITFTLIGCIFSILVFNINLERNGFSLLNSLLTTFMVAVPFIVVGVLFIWHSRLHKH